MRAWLVLAALVTACKGDLVNPPDPPASKVGRVLIAPGDTTVAVGADVVLRLSALDATGSILPAPSTSATWTALDPGVVTVTAAGVGETRAIGTGRVIASLDGAADTVQIVVKVRFVEIPIGTGNNFTEVYGVNDAGIVVGAAYFGFGPPFAFVWTAAGGPRLLPNLPSPTGETFSQARAINETGTITGYSYDGVAYRLVTWLLDGAPTALGAQGAGRTIGTGVNSRGQIAVWNPSDGEITQPEILRYDGPGQVAILPSDSSATPRAIGEDGSIVGAVASRAMVWRPGGAIEFLGGIPAPSFAEAIASGDRIAGWYEGAPGTRAFLWTPTTGPAPLGTLGGTGSAAYGMNDAAEIVGSAQLSNGEWHAFRWTQADGLLDLHPFPGTTSSAVAISRSGIVAGVIRSSQTPFIANAGRPAVWYTRRSQLPPGLPLP